MRKVWEERGQKPPAAFEREVEDEDGDPTRPELDWLEQQYLVLFQLASTCRPVSFGGLLPIPFTAVAEVLERHDWTGAEFRTAAHLIRQLDSEVLEHYARDSKRSAKNR